MEHFRENRRDEAVDHRRGLGIHRRPSKLLLRIDERIRRSVRACKWIFRDCLTLYEYSGARVRFKSTGTITGSGSPDCSDCKYASNTINFESQAYYVEAT